MNNNLKHYREWIPITVRALRGNRTQTEIAQAAGISVSYLSDIEVGRTEPSLKVLDAIFTACGVTLTLSYEDDKDNLVNEWIYVRRDTLREIVNMVREIDPDASSD
ncbi:MAG: helix-turn-helix transcriptional regulator [Anaerolineae bacterium]|nr:helix-turn-helix transcriptional regulator [Anaerolineae bacterium]